jgi:hypothetical protein
MSNIIIKKGALSPGLKAKAIAEIAGLDETKDWRYQVVPHKAKRTDNQNRFLHGVSLRIICDETGNDIEDVKDFLLGEAFGWAEYEVLGAKKRKPMKRSSDLDVEQFNWFIEFIESWAAQGLGIIIPKPNEHIIPEDTR